MGSLRIVRHWLARAQDGWLLAQAGVRIGGGPGKTFGRVIRVFRRDGVPGLKRGLARARWARQLGARPDDYTEWVRRYDTVTDAVRARVQERLRTWPSASVDDGSNRDGVNQDGADRAGTDQRGEASATLPLISVLMPVYNANLEWLAAAIASVRCQLYPAWELCIADDASSNPAVRALLERQAGEDARIKLVFRTHNGHISAATNSALGLATGTWAALLDQDDLLSEHALFWVADAIVRQPRARLIYSDEDKLDANGARCQPYFKCAWNLDLFYSQNLFSHLGVYHMALLREAGGFSIGMEGSQDYDLALRCLERIGADQVHHIPRVLYHWRVHEDSAAHSVAAKPYAVVAAERALNAHFARQGISATAVRNPYGYAVRYALPAAPPLVTLMIPTRNGLQRLRHCLDSVHARTTYPHYEVLVIDNGSDDAATLTYLASIDSTMRIRVLRDARPFNFSALNNAALAHARGSLICLLNDDVEVIAPDWLSDMVSHALRPGVGAVGARLLFADHSVQHAGVILGLRGVAGHAHYRLPGNTPGYFGRAALTQAFSAVTAACLVVKKSLYEEVGGMNETDLAVAYGDVDFCLKLQAAGYRNVLAANAQLLHHESATRGDDDTPPKRARLAAETAYMQQRWGNLLRNDPAYSPNLTLDYADFSLAWPPRVDPP